MGIVGTSLRIIIRTDLGQPGSLIGDDKIYNVIVTTHAFIIIFFIVIPVIIDGFANLFVPFILGAADIAFPAYNLSQISTFRDWVVLDLVQTSIFTGQYHCLKLFIITNIESCVEKLFHQSSVKFDFG